MFKKVFNSLLILVVISGILACMNPISPPGVPENSPPNPLVGPSSVLIVKETAVLQTVQLISSNNPDNSFLFDNDGDPVTVVIDSNTPLPSYMTLDNKTGLLSIVNATGSNPTVNFWTVDDNGGTTKDSSLSLTLTLYNNSDPYPISGPLYMTVLVQPEDTTEVLIVDTQGGLNDPDGDVVLFAYNIVSQTAGIEADIIVSLKNVNGTGVISVTHPGSHMYGQGAELQLWTIDPFGATSSKYTFYINYGSS